MGDRLTVGRFPTVALKVRLVVSPAWARLLGAGVGGYLYLVHSLNPLKKFLPELPLDKLLELSVCVP